MARQGGPWQEVAAASAAATSPLTAGEAKLFVDWVATRLYARCAYWARASLGVISLGGITNSKNNKK